MSKAVIAARIERERLAKIAVLRGALARLRRLPAHEYTGVCEVITAEGLATPPAEFMPAPGLVSYIGRQLWSDRKNCWLNDWLRTYRPNLPRHAAAMKGYRMQWIDWMIASLEGKN